MFASITIITFSYIYIYTDYFGVCVYKALQRLFFVKQSFKVDFERLFLQPDQSKIQYDVACLSCVYFQCMD